MAKKKASEDGVRRYPSRDKVKYAAVPTEMWEALQAIGEEEERSVAYMVKVAVREFLERKGRLPG